MQATSIRRSHPTLRHESACSQEQGASYEGDWVLEDRQTHDYFTDPGDHKEGGESHQPAWTFRCWPQWVLTLLKPETARKAVPAHAMAPRSESPAPTIECWIALVIARPTSTRAATPKPMAANHNRTLAERSERAVDPSLPKFIDAPTNKRQSSDHWHRRTQRANAHKRPFDNALDARTS